ncbi:glucose-6-phosphate isomerase [Longibacter salinarum]|uniref:Glucose-6-phosphate isomerase n=1 Tax=Longibacter salinarum TaxID=1850348 RepID=A0A2A8CVF5_9BACT|nr:glucose-6-phosphate isomerase [Longibacter salinarum]PEN12574.1 glucose-6-phosphate isomerase [Longibacter salinarum]
MIRLDDSRALDMLDDGALDDLQPKLTDAHQAVLDKSGAGSDFLGWRDLLTDPDDALLEDIETTAAHLRRDADVLLCLGIGGSYLGAKAVIDALTPYFKKTSPATPDLPGKSDQPDDPPEVLFAGNQTSGAYLRELLESLEGKSVFVNVISKSGTTLETALSFRFVRQWMEDHFEDADDRIIVTTDPEKGVLNTLRDEHPYKKYVIPRDVGGRFSVMTPVGLLPIAAAGIDIRSFFYGAVSACEELKDAEDNPALQYAGLRYLLLEEGYDVDVLAVFEPKLRSIGGWWQQLMGESEGKDGTGLFPAVVQYTTDLHSLGQYMQDGQRIVLETFLMVEDDDGDLTIPQSEDNLDGLNYVAGKTMSDVTRGAYEGTAQAHSDGGVPILSLWMDSIDPGPLGELLYFFEHAVAVSGYLLGVNPFNQPGVEDYKREMFDRLGK